MEITGKMYLDYESTTEGPLEKVVDIPEGVFVDEDYAEEYRKYEVLTTKRHVVPVKLIKDDKGLYIKFKFEYPDFPVQDVISYYINGPFDGSEMVYESGNDIYSMNTRNLLLRNIELIMTGGFSVFEWDNDKYHSWNLIMTFEDDKLLKYFNKENVEWTI
jgi:hypothetical protein